ncbi:MAG: hypothetical protein ABIO36_11115, partial [Pyrinomonadaceae bacterium]
FIGFFVPSEDYTTTVEINSPRDITWKTMRERKDWIDGFKSLEQISGKPDEVGSHSQLLVVRDGVEYKFDSELIDIKPPEIVETKLDNELLVHEARVQLSEVDGKTKVVSTEKITGKNPFLRSLFAFVKSRFTAVSAKNFEGLKRVVEASK